jgi:protein involved in polysaccharide export with SLBB domain
VAQAFLPVQAVAFRTMPHPRLPFLTALLLGLCISLHAAKNADDTPPPSSASSASSSAVTDPSYRLSTGDTIAITIFDEPELAATQTIARTGEVRIPLIGEIILTEKPSARPNAR